MKGPVWGFEAPSIEVAHALRRARTCLTKPGAWAAWFPRDTDGCVTAADSERAAAWPVIDAIELFAPDVRARLVAEELLWQAVGTSWEAWEGSRGRTQGEVLAALDRAVVRALACARGEAWA